MIFKEESIKFYDDFDLKLIEDYLNNNKRLSQAIPFAIQAIPSSTQQILDIGCGIGWSSAEISKHWPHSKVTGIDISPKLITTASSLFGSRSNLHFENGDFTSSDFEPVNKVGAFILIDVFEHIHSNDRDGLVKFIQAKSGPEGGRIILTCPTVKHQTWLEENKPEGLQPIDEKIDRAVLELFAQKLDGQILYYQEQHIWTEGDYFHCIIQFGKKETVTKSALNIKLESKWSRWNRVRRVNKAMARNFLRERLKRLFL